ncbi:MAG: SagB/ThcOx family dehydrogenase [Candidatus Hodarchaeales archaeon]
MEEFRKTLKMWDEEKYTKEFPESDQKKKLPQPPMQKDYPKETHLIDLVPPEEITIGDMPFRDVVNKRKSHRKFTDDPLSLEELSFLLWCTQGVKKVTQNQIKRTTPSAGARHPFETYIIVNRVKSLEQGLYRYISIGHKLCFLKSVEDTEVIKLTFEKYTFVTKGAVIFCWVAIPYRMEWRHSILSSKFIALEAGHICQNLYLACETINAGTCALGFYNQGKIDDFLDVNGEDEFTIYIAPVGKAAK